MKNPLKMFVSATVYELASSLSYSNTANEIVQADDDKENIIDLGKVSR